MIKPAVFILTGLLANQCWATSDELITQGEYMARASDCAACHTASGGEPFAGGLAMQTPVGNIYTPNITPDSKTGIGDYSLEQFTAALREGQSPQGPMYPAMPYTSYSKLTDTDIAALYAYFMESVAPVVRENQSSDIPWPLSMRWPLHAWKALFLEDGVYQPDRSKSDQWNRGAYLVQGPGHCGACHTPRGIGFQEKGLNETSDDFLAGAELDGWWATNLHGDWDTGIGALSAEEIASLLEDGMGGQVSVSGSMAEVISHSTQYLTQDDRLAIGVYLKALTPDRDSLQTAVNQPTYNGAELYSEYCSTCHGSNGSGYPDVTPTLAGNPTVNADNPSSLIRVLLDGMTTPVTGPGHTRRLMPGYGWTLNDQQIAELATFLRSRWGNSADSVPEERVKDLR